MNSEQKPETEDRAVVANRTMEIVVAALFLLFGLVFAWGSYSLGSGWSDDGPQSGYFPFYINVLIVIASLATLLQALRGRTARSADAFVTRGQLRQVMAVLIPAMLYVLGVQLFGIYLASAAYIALFMVWVGKYSWIKALALGLAVSVVVYFMFEVWFKVALHKGSWFNPLSLFGL
jgi:Tripartite tricarboxylate transporter TctB family